MQNFSREVYRQIFVSIALNGKALCLICSESFAVLKEYGIARHYNSKQRKLQRYSEKRNVEA
jgi:hypothetical protein